MKKSLLYESLRYDPFRISLGSNPFRIESLQNRISSELKIFRIESLQDPFRIESLDTWIPFHSCKIPFKIVTERIHLWIESLQSRIPFLEPFLLHIVKIPLEKNWKDLFLKGSVLKEYWKKGYFLTALFIWYWKFGCERHKSWRMSCIGLNNLHS